MSLESFWAFFGFFLEAVFLSSSQLYDLLVGARGFEPPTTCTPCRYATRLRYAPTVLTHCYIYV